MTIRWKWHDAAAFGGLAVCGFLVATFGSQCGALVDDFRLTHGFWEAKDIHDDLRREVRRKFEAGYPRDNILFQTPRRALLYQNDTLAIDADLTRPQALIDTLELLFSYTAPAYDQWERAVS